MYFLALEPFLAFLFPLQLLTISIKMPDSKFARLALHCFTETKDSYGSSSGLVTLLYPQFIHYTPPHRKLLADFK